MQHGEYRKIQIFNVWKQAAAMLLLWTLLAVFAPAVSSAQYGKAPEGMVYCPLSHKFQPINPPEKKTLKFFEDICASDARKDFLFREIIIKNPFRQISFDENKLDDLAFDFLAHGDSALKKLPDLPNLPFKYLRKQVGSGVVGGNDYNRHFVRQQDVQFDLPTSCARPPTGLISKFSTNKLIYQSDELSRRTAPRAPPVRS